MKIILSQISDPNNKLSKTTTSEVETQTGRFRQLNDFGFSDMSFTVDISDENAKKSNYLYCEDLERYYFISEKKAINSGAWEFVCHIDVLMTYKDQIKTCYGITKRSASKGLGYVFDDKDSLGAKPLVYVRKFFKDGAVETFGDDKTMILITI